MNTIIIYCGDEVLDSYTDTDITIDYRSCWLLDYPNIPQVCYDIRVPATRKNNKVLAFNEVVYSDGIRERIDGLLMCGVLQLKGVIYVIESTQEYHNLLFVVEKLERALDVVPVNPTGLTLTYRSGKDEAVGFGRIPSFGFYQYGNMITVGTIGEPVSLYPTANFGDLLDAYAQALGLSIRYPDASLGRMYQADAYGLVLDRMSIYNNEYLSVSGSGVSGWSVTGGALQDAGLHLVTKRMKRGLFNENITVYCFEATRATRVIIAAGSGVVFVKGNGYELLNDWLGADGFDWEMSTGDYFTAVAAADWEFYFGQKKWRGGAQAVPGYSTNATFTFEALNSSSVVMAGDNLSLDYNLPNLTFIELLKAYCLLILAMYEIIGNEVIITPLDDLLNNKLQAPRALEEEKVIRIERIQRYIDGWAQRNLIDCKSSATLTENDKYWRVIGVRNDYLDEERIIATIPFNEGEVLGRMDDRLGVWIDNVEKGSNNEMNYSGVLTIIYENNNQTEPGAIHIKQTLLDGLGRSYSDFTEETTMLQVRVYMPIADYLQISNTTTYSYNGRHFIVSKATWSKGVALLDLLSLPL